jgi:hypothetical protein
VCRARGAAPARRKHPESQRSCAQAAGASAHTPTARRSVRLPRLTPSDDAPEHTHAHTHAPEHTQMRAAPFTSRAEHQKTTRSAPDRMGQFRSQGWHPRRTAPRQARPAPSDPPTSAQTLRRSARASRARAHTPTTRRSSASPPPPHAAHSRADPEKPAPRRRSPTDARRTFKKPPRACVERAREWYAGVRALTRSPAMHPGSAGLSLGCASASARTDARRALQVARQLPADTSRRQAQRWPGARARAHAAAAFTRVAG